MHRSWLVALPLLAGCDAVFGLTEPRGDAGTVEPQDGGDDADGGPGLDGGPTLDGGPSQCFTDGFDANVVASTWDIYADTSCAQAVGLTACAVRQGASRVLMAVNGAAGYVGATRPPVDFAGARVEVEMLPTSILAGTSGYMSLALDSTYQIRFVIDVYFETSRDTPELTWTRVDKGGNDTTETRLGLFAVRYDAALHRHWQIAHVIDNGAPALALSTRASATEPWVTQRVVPVPESFATTLAEIGAGRYEAGTLNGDTTYGFDSFSLCTPP